jgi:hypothetical protein
MKFSLDTIFGLLLVAAGVLLTIILAICFYCALSELLDEREMRKLKIEHMKKNGIDLTHGAC